jgi:hypothetical protein
MIHSLATSHIGVRITLDQNGSDNRLMVLCGRDTIACIDGTYYNILMFDMWNLIPETIDRMDLRELQVRRFREQAIYADKNRLSPFYRAKFVDAKIDPSTVGTMAAVREVPRGVGHGRSTETIVFQSWPPFSTSTSANETLRSVTSTDIDPTDSIAASTVSPSESALTPSGVPVVITSPASMVVPMLAY